MESSQNLDSEKETKCPSIKLQMDNSLEETFDSVVAISNYTALGENQLSFKRGDCIHILDRVTVDWLWADIDGAQGYIPSNHVKNTAEFEEMEKWQDEEYFESYCHMRLHLEMLSDYPRTDAYRQAVVSNTNSIEGRVVLDVGCGTGILSMFCARDGKAGKVYAVEASMMADYVTQVVKDNSLDGIVNVIKGRVETFEPNEQIDIIISEWMGTFLLFEYMIDSVLYARDNFLKVGGTMWPSVAQLFIVPCTATELYEKKVGVWKQQYGFNFSTLQKKAVADFFSRPIIDHVLDPEDCLCDPQPIAILDMMLITVQELESWSCNFQFVIGKQEMLYGFGSWFDVEFHALLSATPEPVVLSTGPKAPQTHWKNAIFMLDDPVKVSQGSVIVGTITVVRNPDFRRHMTVSFDFNIFEKEISSSMPKHILKDFKLWR